MSKIVGDLVGIPEKTAKKQGGRFQPGVSGNPKGRARGSRNKATLLLEKLIDGEGEGIIRAMIQAAVGGDVSAGRALLDRLVPPRRDRVIQFALPPLATIADAPRALGAITAAVAAGDLTPSEASDLATLVERFVKAIEASTLESRISALEMKGS